MGKSKQIFRKETMAHVQKNKDENPMKSIQIDKIVINLSVGESGDKVLKAVKVLKDLTGQEPVVSKCKYTIRSWKEVSKLRNTNCQKAVSPKTDTLDSVSRNISIWESDTIHIQVFSEWTSTLY